MKKIHINILSLALAATVLFTVASCRKDLLNQQPTTELGGESFWQTEADATYALQGAYTSVRACFDRDYYFDGQGEYVRTRNSNNSTSGGDIYGGAPYRGGGYNPTGYGSNFNTYYRYLYGAVNRTNYVIDNVNKMLPQAKAQSVEGLEAIIAEARLLRGMVYFRLISMWGDVPYIGHTVLDNAQVQDLARMPIAQVKDSIIADFTFAAEKLPQSASQLGRAAKPAALAFRGKLQLFWGSWKKNGWPELEGFQANATEAKIAFGAAAADFKSVIDDFGLTLYKNGEPGDIDGLGKAEVLPNYYYLFTPLANEDNPEMLMVFTHGGTGTGQGEELMRDFAGRSHEGSQLWVSPRYEIADRYQSIVTGEFLSPLTPVNPSKFADARTMENSTLNPQSYADRDYRMKSTIQWDYEMSVGMKSLKSTGFTPYIYKSWGANITIGGENYITYNTDGTNSGYVFRKFVRNYAGQGRSDGDYAFPVMRLADVYLMYAEATNEYNGPQEEAIALVNKVRHRGNLPPLTSARTGSKEAFFAAIEQERIVELIGEGQRPFDLRRWRAIERIWGAPGGSGVWRIDTWGAQQSRYYQNTSERTYQQNYIFKIPQSERDRNPNLTQNTPWM
ncbi:RagB/SusD family nutrient uptake outer membrane protein [Sphingobacterium sp. JB170]|uniref:RagB/SusD family nutrient uptake outer membrane protein n=1 Tax=Sphingobacterium sp. JB170 TaxID=1434842 RepID=UPI00097F1159|nr:RagB/SusD family nutrient uptake outer membrane protein [Sphingobacterium sp. JB170]SJN46655.1 putative outer membrane protein, probably involved in nutrient binding [Sphingobacterium sp. JB170]